MLYQKKKSSRNLKPKTKFNMKQKKWSAKIAAPSKEEGYEEKISRFKSRKEIRKM